MTGPSTLETLWTESYGPSWPQLETITDTRTPKHPVQSPVAPHGPTLQLRQPIGQGGFADVFLAHQRTLAREVAVKQPRASASEAARQLFSFEARITAGLSHPNIPPIHDFTSVNGEPALVMKRITGTPWGAALTESWNTPQWSLEREIRRLIMVCHALDFAHSRGVLHLDIKPANVMIGEFGEVLLVDWGCAVLFDDARWTHQPDLPRAASVRIPFGTPAFMAPEQATADAEKLGIPTDLYLIGATLQLLLTGAPIRSGSTLQEVIHDAAIGGRAPLPSSTPPALARLCRSLTEPAPEARSPSLPELVRELEHWLDTREARRLTARALKVVETLETSENLTPDQVREGNQLVGILEQAGRRGAGLQEAIAGERRLRTCLADQALKNGEPAVVRALVQPLPPELRAPRVQQARALLARQLTVLDGEVEPLEAVAQSAADLQTLEGAVQALQRTLGAQHPDTLRCQVHLGRAMALRARLAEAEALLTAARAGWDATVGQLHPEALSTAVHLAGVWRQQGRFDDAAQLLTRTLEHADQLLGQEHPLTCSARYVLGIVRWSQRRFASARGIFERLCVVREQSLGPAHPESVRARIMLASTLLHTGMPEEAEAIYLRLVDLLLRNGEDGSHHLRIVRNNLVAVYSAQERFDEAHPIIQGLLDADIRIYGWRHTETLTTANNLGVIGFQMGALDESRALLQRVHTGRSELLGPSHPATIHSAIMLSEVQTAAGSGAEAEALLRQSLAAVAEESPSEPARMIDLNHALAEVLAATGRTEEAERAFVRTLEEAWSCMESDDQKLRAMTESYLAFLDKLGRTEDAAAERARFAALAGGVHPA